MPVNPTWYSASGDGYTTGAEGSTLNVDAAEALLLPSVIVTEAGPLFRPAGSTNVEVKFPKASIWMVAPTVSVVPPESVTLTFWAPVGAVNPEPNTVTAVPADPPDG